MAENSEPQKAAVNLDLAGDDGIIELTEVVETPADSDIIELTDFAATKADDRSIEPAEGATDTPVIEEEVPLELTDVADAGADDDLIELTEVAAASPVIKEEVPLELTDVVDAAADDDIIELTEVAADSPVIEEGVPLELTDVVDAAADDDIIELTEVAADSPVVDEDKVSDLSGIPETLEDDGAYTLVGSAADRLVSDEERAVESANKVDFPADDAIIDLSEVAVDSPTADSEDAFELTDAAGETAGAEETVEGSEPADASINDEFTELPELAAHNPSAHEEAVAGGMDKPAEDRETLVFPDSSTGTPSESDALEPLLVEAASVEEDKPLDEPETLVFPGTSGMASADGVDEMLDGNQNEREEIVAGEPIGRTMSSIDSPEQTGMGYDPEADIQKEVTPDESDEALIGLLQESDPKDDLEFLQADEQALKEDDLAHAEFEGNLLEPDEEIEIPSKGETIDDHEAGMMFAQSLDDDLDAALSVSNETFRDEAEGEKGEDKAGGITVQIENQRDDRSVDFKFESRLHPGDKVYTGKEIGVSDVAVSQEQVEAVIRQVVKEMLSEKIDKVLDDILKKTIGDEIKKIKDMLLKE